MPEIKPIPTPLYVHWRQIRFQLIPPIVFTLVLGTIFYLWEQELTPTSMTGEVYGVVNEVSPPRSGILQELYVDIFDTVSKGDLIARIQLQPPELIQAAIDVLQAEIELTRLGGMDPILDQQRNLLSWQSMQQDWLAARANLASLTIRRQQAEREYIRYQQLAQDKHVSASEADRLQSQFDALAAEEEETRKLVEALEQSVSNSRRLGDGTEFDIHKSLQATLHWQEMRMKQLEADLKPAELRAPLSGIVTMLLQKQGAFVREGLPLLTIRSEVPQHIVGYIRQPSNLTPEPGATVEVMTRGGRRHTTLAQIIKVGAQYEALGPAFQRPYNTLEERALPVLISMPIELALRPGEIVDIRLIPNP